MTGKCSRNGLKVGMWCCYVVGRPLAKFHRIWSSFDSPTIKLWRHYSRSNIGRFRSPEIVVGPLSLFSSLSSSPSAQPTSANRPLACASETSPEPTRAVVIVVSGSSPNIYKTSSFSYLDTLAIYSQPYDFNRMIKIPLLPHIKTPSPNLV